MEKKEEKKQVISAFLWGRNKINTKGNKNQRLGYYAVVARPAFQFLRWDQPEFQLSNNTENEPNKGIQFHIQE